MLTVWKFPLDLVDRQEIVAPSGSKPVLVAVQNDVITLWMEVTVNAMVPSVTREVYIRGTGHSIKPGVRHAGSVIHGDFVWHVYLTKTLGELVIP